jgi:hypothetical protein
MFQIFGALGLVWVVAWQQLDLNTARVGSGVQADKASGEGGSGSSMYTVLNLDKLQDEGGAARDTNWAESTEEEVMYKSTEDEVMYREEEGLVEGGGGGGGGGGSGGESGGGGDGDQGVEQGVDQEVEQGVEQTQVLSLQLVRKLFSQGPFCAIVFAHWANNFGQQIMLIWTPTYFHTTFNVGMEKL